jgi:hypothetical protein
MIRVTATSFVIEGDASELDQFEGLKELVSRFSPTNGTASREIDDQDGEVREPSSSWSHDELAEMWKLLRPEAKQILAELAKKPGGYPFGELQRVTGKRGVEIGGNLSSVGFAIRRFPGKNHPLTKNYSMHEWSMQPEVAEVIRELSENE